MLHQLVIGKQKAVSSSFIGLGAPISTRPYGLGVLFQRLDFFETHIYNKTFSNTRSAHWAKANIEVMEAKHIISVVSETCFDPAGKVTHDQFDNILVRVLGIPSVLPETVADVSEGQWYTEYVEAVEASGIINGVAATDLIQME